MSRVEGWLPWVAGAGVLLTLCVMGLGAFTRLMDAGLGCPDWPGCYGHWLVPKVEEAKLVASHIPLVAYKAWAEMIHRYVAGFLATLTLIVLLGLAYLSFCPQEEGVRQSSGSRAQLVGYARSKVALHPEDLPPPSLSPKVYPTLAIGLLSLITYQILLGRWTVTLHLLPIIVTQHLLGAMGILSLLGLTVLSTGGFLSEKLTFPTHIKLLPFIGLVLLLLQIVLGAWTSTHYASLSCTDFPFCHNEGAWFPTHLRQAFHVSTLTQLNYEGGLLPHAARQTIHMTHRLGALILSSYLLFMVAMLWCHARQNTFLLVTTFCTVGVLLAQITLGIANVLFQLPLIIAIAHNVMASLLLLCLVTLCYGVTAVQQGGGQHHHD